MPKVIKDFSIEKKLKALITLQKVDSKIDEIRILKGELPMEVNDLEDEVEGLKTRITNIDSEITSINEYINNERAGKKEADNLIKKYEEQHDKVKNNREYEAVTKEIELQELEKKLCDKHIRDAEVRLQESQHAKMLSEGQLDVKNERLSIKKEELEKIIKETEGEELNLEEKSITAKEKVEPRLLKAYDRIRTNYRNGLAVVPVLRDSCGGCFNFIPPQRQYEIQQHKKIIACEHCGRILIDSEFSDSVKGPTN